MTSSKKAQPQPCALICASNKQGLVAFAAGLHALNWKIVGTTGTVRCLAKHGIPAHDVCELTQAPMLLHGRVKTLNTRVFGGLLMRHGNAKDEAEAASYEMLRVHLLVGNFYEVGSSLPHSPRDAAATFDCIDVGGPAMLRAAAKNHSHVIPLWCPEDYSTVLEALRTGNGDPSACPETMRRALARSAFDYTSAYDKEIARWL